MAKRLEDLLRACTVRVLGGPMPGAGFLIAPGRVVTCCHVIGESRALSVRWERDGEPPVEVQLTGRVLALADKGRPIPALDRDYPDVAVLEVGGLVSHPCVGVDAEWPSPEDRFQIFGYPEEGGSVQLTPARLAYRGTKGIAPTSYLDLASDTVKPGMSGAAVLNLRSGGVCGVIVASKHPAHPDGALAIPWSAIGAEVSEVLAANRAFHLHDRRWNAAAAAGRAAGTALTLQLDSTTGSAFRVQPGHSGDSNEGKSVGRPSPTIPKQVNFDRRWAMILVRDAERLARAITGKGAKARALARVARAVAVSNPNRAASLIEEAVSVARSYTVPPDYWSSPGIVVEMDPEGTFLAWVLSDIASTMVTWNPSQAERLVVSIFCKSRSAQGEARAIVARGLARTDLERAERLAESISDPLWKAQALAGIAQAVTDSKPGRAAELVQNAKHVIESVTAAPSLWHEYRTVDKAWEAIAAALARADPGRAEQTVGLISASGRAAALARLAELLAPSDPGQAQRLAESIVDQRYKAVALASIAQALAASNLERAALLIDDAEHIAQMMSGQRWQEDQAAALASVALALATTDPDRAELLADSIADQERKGTALAGIAQAVATTDPGNAVRLAVSIADKQSKATALAGIAQTVATFDPERGERVARSIAILELKVSALVDVARIGLKDG